MAVTLYFFLPILIVIILSRIINAPRVVQRIVEILGLGITVYLFLHYGVTKIGV